MQAFSTHRSVTPLPACERAAVTAPVRGRKALVVRASSQSHSDGRRQVLGGLLAGLAVISSGSGRALALDLEDERDKARMAGFDIIYEARELELPQNVRDGLSQARVNTDQTKARVKESEKRIDTKLAPFINKAYWTDAREELRLQMGTLRFDLGVLGEKFPKAQRKSFTDAKKTLFAAADKLDFAIRQKNKSDATEALSNVKTKLDDIVAKVI